MAMSPTKRRQCTHRDVLLVAGGRLGQNRHQARGEQRTPLNEVCEERASCQHNNELKVNPDR